MFIGRIEGHMERKVIDREFFGNLFFVGVFQTFSDK